MTGNKPPPQRPAQPQQSPDRRPERNNGNNGQVHIPKPTPPKIK